MGLKQNLKQILIEKQHRRYEAEIAEKKVSYGDWIQKQEKETLVDYLISGKVEKCQKNEKTEFENEGNGFRNEGFDSKNDESCRILKIHDQVGFFTFLMLSYDVLKEKDEKTLYDAIKNSKADVVLFLASESNPAPFALQLLCRKFRENQKVILVYGDEDVEEDGERKKPWFKPDWSPDTFLYSFYFGSMVAIRAEAVLSVLGQISKRDEKKAEYEKGYFGLYELCQNVIEAAGGFSLHETLWREEPVCHIPEILVHTQKEGYGVIRDFKLSENQKDIGEISEEMVSVIIPSKDNPEVLFTCVHSFIERTKTGYPYEIIIVDNGSREENKEKIRREIETLNQKKEDAFRGITYHYEPMIFNFSRMCNLGASISHGNLLLFLNDDMEIIQGNWLTLLVKKAVLSYAGAVGAKLLYPDSRIIQHAGITNLRVGPAHKLQFLSDEMDHYYGKNRGVQNMLAVTGACLMVKREIFDQVGGFAEELAVAFNDVDLCYQIYEAGYYNMVRNDVVLYHHESLSRGKDGESEEKQLRLLREKDILYEKHQEIYGKDPFYHKYLTTDMLESEYSPAFRYQVTLDMPWAEAKQEESLSSRIREDGCVVIGMEAAMDIYKWKYGVDPDKGKKEPDAEDMGYYFQGYSFIIGSDNACYRKTLLLENKGNRKIIRVPLDSRYRPDIRNNLKDQLNVDLTGFAAKVRLSDIPKGEYRFGMLVEDKCSRQKLVNWSSWVLQV